jgi:GTP pyrophosphokinase
VGAKIHGRIRPLKTELKNGDIVEILTTTVEQPNPEWENFVVTGKARYTIRKFIRASEVEEFVALGQSLAERAFAEHGQKFTKKAIKQALKRLELKTEEEVYERMGRGELGPRRVLEAAFPGLDFSAEVEGKPKSKHKAPSKQRGGEKKPIPIRGLTPGIAVHLAECCHPIPGDRIVGIVEPGHGVKVHTIDCETLRTYQDELDNWLDLSWDERKKSNIVPVGRIKLSVLNQRGTLGTITSVIADNGANISNLKIEDRGALLFEMVVDVEVEDLKHLTQIIAALRAALPVQSAERVRGWDNEDDAEETK